MRRGGGGGATRRGRGRDQTLAAIAASRHLQHDARSTQGFFAALAVASARAGGRAGLVLVL